VQAVEAFHHGSTPCSSGGNLVTSRGLEFDILIATLVRIMMHPCALRSHSIQIWNEG
jgi:hypothetical protein